jgi:exoribonuclease R
MFSSKSSLIFCAHSIIPIPLHQESTEKTFLNRISYTGMYQNREANQMIEEFMLAANISVAEKILKHYPLCGLLR